MIRLAQLRYCYSADAYKVLRVYRNYSGLQLANALMVNRAAATPWLVANSMRMYKIAKRICGTRFTNAVVEKTFGKVFTAGKTLDQVDAMSRDFVDQGIPVIIDYCGEGFIDSKSHEAELDTNAEMFKLTAQEVSKHQNQMISIKVSGLVDMPTLRKLNNGVTNIHQFWDKYSKDGALTGEQLLQGFQAVYPGVTEQDVTQFLKVVLGYEGTLQELKCDQIDFNMKVHPYYIEGDAKNHNKLLNLFCPLSKEELTLAGNLIRRIDNIVNPFASNKTNFKIIIDAEQSYIQKAIFSISEQYQKKFNKDKIYIIPTLQNYLVKATERLNYELEIAKRNNLMFVMKFVRGAYLVQERRIAAENKVPCEVVENFDKTTENFMNNVESCLKADLLAGSQLVIASHNQDTLEDIKILNKKHPNPNAQVEYAQLLGLADHLTIQLKQQGYPVYKYLPYGPTSTMVPYLIRRAQELSQMKYPLKLQYDLIVDQFKQRIGLTS